MVPDRDVVLKDLRENVVEVQFTKVNGQQRNMWCTLRKDLLPESYSKNLNEQENEKSFHKENADVIAAWDIRAGGWRSFRIDSVEYMQIKDGF